MPKVTILALSTLLRDKIVEVSINSKDKTNIKIYIYELPIYWLQDLTTFNEQNLTILGFKI
jgi:hypothetical protein